MTHYVIGGVCAQGRVDTMPGYTIEIAGVCVGRSRFIDGGCMGWTGRGMEREPPGLNSDNRRE